MFSNWDNAFPGDRVKASFLLSRSVFFNPLISLRQRGQSVAEYTADFPRLSSELN